MISVPQKSSGAREASSDQPAHAEDLNSETAFEIRNLSVRYGKKVALREVNLEIPRGSVTALVGPSGCGKSTFLAVLNRMCDTVPGCKVEGDVQFQGQDLNDPSLDVALLRRQVGIIFQKPAPFPFSIWRNLEMPLREHGVRSAGEIEARIEQGLRDVGLWEEVAQKLHASALNLSGGQQQRLCLARTLVLRPEVLLMDEPCSALDPFATIKIESLIASLRESYTVVIVTHNLAQARRVSDYCVMFWCDGDSGCVVESGPTERMFDAPQELLTERFIRGCVG